MRFWRSIVAVVFGLLIGLGSVAGATTVQAAASTNLKAQVGRPGTTWSDSLTVHPAELINLVITYTNENQFTQKSVSVHDTLPQNAVFASKSAYLFSPTSPQGVQQKDTLTASGIDTGALKSGESAFVEFQMTMPSAASLVCGNNMLTNHASVTYHSGKTYQAATHITVQRVCTSSSSTNSSTPSSTSTTSASATSSPAPVNNAKYGCGQGFTFYKSKTRLARIHTFDWVAKNGAAYEGSDIGWGDNTVPQSVMDPTGLSHTYAADGQYTVTATLHFTVAGKPVQSKKCSETIMVKLKPVTNTANTTTDSNNTVTIIQTVYVDNSTNSATDGSQPGSDDQVAADTSDSSDTSDSDQSDATTPDDGSGDTVSNDDSTDAKSLVDTGAGNVFGIFIIASLVGAVASRLILYKILGA